MAAHNFGFSDEAQFKAFQEMALSVRTDPVESALFNAKVVGLAALIAVVVYIAGFALSWGPVAWVMLSEMFPNAIKGKAMGLAVAAQWIANLLVSASFKVLDGNSMLNAMFNHGFAYWIYGGMSVLAALFVMRYVPETKGRSLEAIQDLWGKSRPKSGMVTE